MKIELIDRMGTDLTVVNAARVSYAKIKETFDDKDEKLIKYLAEHEHWSPFAHASMQFRIKAPIFVARQLVKHQVGLSWNEVSRRYVDVDLEFYKPDTWRGRAALSLLMRSYMTSDPATATLYDEYSSASRDTTSWHARRTEVGSPASSEPSR